MKKYVGLAVLLLLSIFTVSLVAPSDDANAWLGLNSTGSGGSTYYGGGGGGASVYDTGVSWIRYEYVGGSDFRNWSVWFPPDNGGNLGAISTECAEEGNGFWHFGRNQTAYFYHDMYSSFAHFGDERQNLYCDWPGCWDPRNRYSTRTGAFGHLGTYNWGYATGKGLPYRTWGLGDLDHYIYAWVNFPGGGGEYRPIYRAVEISNADGKVWDDYYATLESDGDTARLSSAQRGVFDDSLYAFCSNPKPAQKKLHVNYVYEQKANKCSKSKSNEWAEYNTYYDDDGNLQIDVDTKISEEEAGGWTTDWVALDDGIVRHGDVVHAYYAEDDGEKIVTVHFSKEDDTDCLCESWIPDSYANSDEWQAETSVTIGVRNASLTNENKDWHHDGEPISDLYNGVVYAKPTDNVQWKYCYFPGVERAAFGMVTHENEHPHSYGHSNDDPLYNDLNNHFFSEYSGWNSAYRAWSQHLKQNEDVQYGRSVDVGDDKPVAGTLPGGEIEKDDQTEETNRFYGVQPRDQATLNKDRSLFAGKLDPGDILYGNIATNGGYTKVERDDQGPHTWGCHRDSHVDEEGNIYWHDHDECRHDESYYHNEKSTAEKNDKARVIVPYNFKNSATAKIKGADDPNTVLYAGEKVTVSGPKAVVGLRNNERTDGTRTNGYATQVDNGRARLVAFLVSPEDYRAGNFWTTAQKTDDGYGNTIDGSKGNLWQSTQEVCGTNGAKNAFNAKNGVCKYLEMYDDKLNENSNLDGAIYDFAEDTHYPATGSEDEWPQGGDEDYSVFDEAAGNYYCVASAVYPFSVRNNEELDPAGDQTWYISQPSCVQIAKKPTFQVWGAGVFSNGGIDTSVSVKNNVLDDAGIWDTSHGYQNMTNTAQGSGWSLGWYPLYEQGTETLFGSWGELDVTAKGTVTKMASGAGTGYRGGYLWGTDAESPWNKSGDFSYEVGKGNPGGVQDPAVNNFCYRSPLTIANISCPGSTGQFGQTEVADALTADKEFLLDRFTPEGANASTYDYITDPSSLTLGGIITVPHGKTVIHVVPGGTTIKSNIHYDQTNLNTLAEVPKYFIKAQGDLNISCDVTRLDAIIIADGTVNTCVEATDDGDQHKNSPSRAHQLVVNGTIVANRIEFKRSFGMGTGIHTMTPAELINYDTSIYLWANRQAEGGNSGQMTEATIRELAPRY